MKQFLEAMRHQHFLVIDPNPHGRALVGQVLRAAGALSVELVPDAPEAIERSRFFVPTVIITEWNLGPMNQDGMVFIKSVRANETPFPRDVAIIVLTERAARADVQTAQMAGVNEYVIKPFATIAIIDRLKAAILHPRPFIDAARYVGPCRRRKLVVDYPGARRRLSDDEVEGDAAVEDEIARNLARAKIASVVDSSRKVDRKRIHEIHGIAQEILAVAGTVDDKSLATAADSLRTYIEGVGASPRFDIEVVSAHVDAMTQIINLPNIEGALREEVTRALQKLVSKRVRGKAA
jgi:CheY-like chemotaxis protein